jgi:2'-5' RNA ligase
MHAIVSILDPLHYKLVEAIWRELETECGIVGIKATPYPHLSWLIAEDFEWSRLDTTIQEIANNLQPFQVRTTGLALFTGPSQVVYIPILRTTEVSRVHEMIWQRMLPLGYGISQNYAPSKWVPHISLAYGDVTPVTLPCIMERLANRVYNWEIEVANLAFINEPTGQAGTLRYRYEFPQ